MASTGRSFTPEMSILDVVADCRETEAVFARYSERVGRCLCCEALFDTLQDVARAYGFEVATLIAELEEAARAGDS